MAREEGMSLWVFALAVLITIILVKAAIYEYPALGKYF